MKYIFCSFLTLILVVVGNAQSQKERLQNENNEISRELNKINKELSSTKSEKKSQFVKINALDKKIEMRSKLVQNLSLENDLASRSLGEIQGRIKSLEAKQEMLKQEYARVIRTSYKKRSRENKMLALLSSNSFSQAYKRLLYIKQYSQYRKKQVEELKKTEEELAISREELAAQKAEKNSLLVEQKSESSKLLNEKDQMEVLIRNLSSKEKQLLVDIRKKQRQKRKNDRQIRNIIAAEIRARKAEEKRLADQRKRKEKEEAMARAVASAPVESNTNTNTSTSSKREDIPKATPATSESSGNYIKPSESSVLSSSFLNNKNRLPWPVEQGRLVSRYGRQQYPGVPGIYIENSGVELACPDNTVVRSVFDGEVIAIYLVGNSSAILIQHGDYYTLYSNVKDVSVSKGQKVSTKQTLGKVAKESGESKIEFQVWHNTTKLDPAGWLSNM